MRASCGICGSAGSSEEFQPCFPTLLADNRFRPDPVRLYHFLSEVALFQEWIDLAVSMT
jgi:hypothetical protein